MFVIKFGNGVKNFLNQLAFGCVQTPYRGLVLLCGNALCFQRYVLLISLGLVMRCWLNQQQQRTDPYWTGVSMTRISVPRTSRLFPLWTNSAMKISASAYICSRRCSNSDCGMEAPRCSRHFSKVSRLSCSRIGDAANRVAGRWGFAFDRPADCDIQYYWASLPFCDIFILRSILHPALGVNITKHVTHDHSNPYHR